MNPCKTCIIRRICADVDTTLDASCPHYLPEDSTMVDLVRDPPPAPPLPSNPLSPHPGMTCIEVWDVQHWDGGDRHVHAYYLRRLPGQTEAQIKPLIGEHNIAFAVLLKVFDTIDDYKAHNVEDLARKVWARLGPLERDALKATGLSKLG